MGWDGLDISEWGEGRPGETDAPPFFLCASQSLSPENQTIIKAINNHINDIIIINQRLLFLFKILDPLSQET